MKVLVFNAGSSSLKFGLFSCADIPQPILLGKAQDIGGHDIGNHSGHLSVRDRKGSIVFEDNGAESIEDASRQIIAALQKCCGPEAPASVSPREKILTIKCRPCCVVRMPKNAASKRSRRAGGRPWRRQEVPRVLEYLEVNRVTG